MDDLKALQFDSVFIELILRDFIIANELATSQMLLVTIQNHPHSKLQNVIAETKPFDTLINNSKEYATGACLLG
jgi:hypothetical protein